MKRSPSFPWVRVHPFYSHVHLLILGVYTLYLRKVLDVEVQCIAAHVRLWLPLFKEGARKWCPLASRCTSHLTHTFLIAHVDSTVKLMTLNSEFLLFRSCSIWGLLLHIYSLTCPTSKDHTGLDVANVEATTPCLVFYHQWYSLYQA